MDEYKEPEGITVMAVDLVYLADEPDKVTVGVGQMDIDADNEYAGQWVVFVNEHCVPINGAMRDVFLAHDATMRSLESHMRALNSAVVNMAAMVAQDYLPRNGGRLGQAQQ